MSKAKRKQQALEKRRQERQKSLTVLAVIVLVVIGGVSAMYFGMKPADVDTMDEGRRAALASEHAPTMGNPEAKVHIVEFLDPACETCALFFPMVKDWATGGGGGRSPSLRSSRTCGPRFDPGLRQAGIFQLPHEKL